MELRELRCLVTLAEVGSITRTAEKLHLSAAAIHKQLKVLEDELGLRLYEKVGRQLRLTQAAEVLLPHVKNLLGQYDAVLSALSEWKGLNRGLVRIGTGPTMSSYLLPSLLEGFRRKFPEIELFVETGNTQHLLDCLGKGSLDLTFLISSELLEEPGLLIEAAWDFDFALVSGMKELPRRCRLKGLQEFPFILYKKGSIFENLIDRYFAENRFCPRVVMRFDMFLSVFLGHVNCDSLALAVIKSETGLPSNSCGELFFRERYVQFLQMVPERPSLNTSRPFVSCSA